MKNVVIFYNAILNPGGAERLMFQEGIHLARLGCRVKILTFKAKPEALYNYRDQVDLEVIEAGGFLSRVYRLRKRLKEINPDLVIAQSAGDAHLLYLTRLDIPYYTHLHGTMFWFPGNLYKYCSVFRGVFNEIRNSIAGHQEFIPSSSPADFVQRVVLEAKALLDYLAVRKSAKVFVLTDQIKWEVEKLYRVKAVLARGCLDSQVFQYQPKTDIREKYRCQGKKIILSIGRLDERKRVSLLIKCFKEIAEEYPDAVLLVGGIGPEEENLKRLVDSLGLNSRVIFAGFIKDEDLYDYHAACDVFAFPSWTTFGIAPYEALALKKNVVWTSEGRSHVLGRPNVFLADPSLLDFSRGLKEALEMKPSEDIDLADLTWDNYFLKIFNEIGLRTAERISPSDFQSKEKYLLYLRHLFVYELVKKAVKGNSVLEVGCGDGYGTKLLSEDAARIVGLDVDEETIVRASGKYGSEKCLFQAYDGFRMPFEDNTFDMAVCFHVIEHIGDDAAFVAEIRRVLKKTGVLFLTTPNKTYRLKPNQKPLNRFHLREYYPHELENVLKSEFSNTKIWGICGDEEAQRIELARVRPGLVRRIMSRLSFSLGKDRSFLNRYSLKNFHIVKEEVENSLDLLGICRKV